MELALFGSALRDELGPESDVDILISFDDKARPTLLDMVRMEDELTELFGRPIFWNETQSRPAATPFAVKPS